MIRKPSTQNNGRRPDPADDPVERILGLLKGVKASGDSGRQWKAYCPAHEGKSNKSKRSLSIKRGDDDKAVLHCFVGCRFAAIMAALGLEQSDAFARDGADRPAGNGSAPKAKHAGPAIDWRAKAEEFAAKLTSVRRRQLAQTLNLPDRVLEALPIGWNADKGGEHFTFAEVDAAGSIIGIVRRYGNGEKFAMPGARRGLTVPRDWNAVRPSGRSAGPLPLFCIEGASDVLAMTAIGLRAIGRPNNVMGAEMLADLLARTPPPDGQARHVVVLGEYDPKPNGHWPGLQGAKSVASQLAAKLGGKAIVKWAMPPLGYKDVRHWVTSLRLDPAKPAAWNTAGENFFRLIEGHLQEATSQANPAGSTATGTDAPWEDPVPLSELPEAESFPLNVFPAQVKVFVEAVSYALACPNDFAATAVLALAGSAIGASRAVQIKEGWRERACIYLATVGNPGTAKTHVLEAVAAPVYAEQATRYADYRLRMKAWKNSGRDGEPPELTTAFVGDVTTEKLASILEKNPRGVALIRDELSGWVCGMDQYKAQGRGTDRQFFLSSWSGTSFRYDRVGREETIIVPHPFVSVVGGIPPALLNRLRGRRDIWDGFIDRILFSYPNPFPAREERWGSVSDDVKQSWSKVLAHLWAFQMELVSEQPSRPQLVRLTSDARHEWVEFTRWLAHEMNREDLADPIKGHLPKFKSYGARLALIIHCIRQACGEVQEKDVDGDDMSRAAALVEYFYSHVQKVHAALDTDPNVVLARKVSTWIGRESVRRFTKREAHYALQGTFKIVDELEPALAVLVRHGLIRPEPAETKPGPGRRPSPAYQVHPNLFSNDIHNLQNESDLEDSVNCVNCVEPHREREPGEEG
jgi:hypothetical protein